MESDVFARFVNIMKDAGLSSTRGVSVEERCAIFLYIVGNNASNRSAQERFQHSGETITRFVVSLYLFDALDFRLTMKWSWFTGTFSGCWTY